MAVTITTIQPQDALATSRLTINSNFSALQAGVNAVQNLLNPVSLTLSGIRSATIDDNDVPFSTSILEVGKGSRFLGNVTMGTVGQPTNVLVNGTGGFTIDQSTLNLTNGSLILSNPNSLADFTGDVKVRNEFRLPGSAVAFASVLGVTGPTSVPVSDLKYLVVRNDSISGNQVIQLDNGSNGQVLEIFHLKGASGFGIEIDILNFSGLTGPNITMTETSDTIRCVFDGISWYLWNYSSASFATSAGPTGSSITFETI